MVLTDSFHILKNRGARNQPILKETREVLSIMSSQYAHTINFLLNLCDLLMTLNIGIEYL